MTKNNTITIRVSDVEKAAIKIRACNAGMSLSKYMIYSSLCQEERIERKLKPIRNNIRKIDNLLSSIPKLNSDQLYEIAQTQKSICFNIRNLSMYLKGSGNADS